MALNIKTKKYYIVVASLYSPPKHNIKTERYVELLKNTEIRFIIGGDFNAKHTHWGWRLISAKGRELLETINEHKCEAISTGKPTYWPTDTEKFPDLIDFYIIKNISSNYIQIEDNLELSSDHSPIILTLSESIIQKPRNPVLVNKKTDWEGFRMTIDQRIQLSVSIQTEKLDFEVEKFINNIQQAAWENTPEIKRRLKGDYYHNEILELISEKRKAKKNGTRLERRKKKLS